MPRCWKSHLIPQAKTLPSQHRNHAENWGVMERSMGTTSDVDPSCPAQVSPEARRLSPPASRPANCAPRSRGERGPALPARTCAPRSTAAPAHAGARGGAA